MLQHWLIDLIGHVSGLSDAQLRQIENSLPATKALIDLLNRAQPIIEQAQSLYAEAQPLIDEAKKEWQTVGPAAQILIDVISHHVNKGSSPPMRTTSAPWRPRLRVPTVLSTRSASMSSMEAIRFIRCTWKRPQGSPERQGGPGPNGLCTYQESAPMRALHRRIFAAGAKARRRCRPHSPAQSSFARR